MLRLELSGRVKRGARGSFEGSPAPIAIVLSADHGDRDRLGDLSEA
jgi:hypothetical protein